MGKRRKLPLVAICGRPNVGKSTLFNRLIGKNRAIVHDQEGITRDRYYSETSWAGKPFRLVDTGGVVERPEDGVVEQMQAQVRAALDEARVILFVLDGQQPLTRVDQELRDELFRYGKPVVLAANKMDNARIEENLYELYELGLGEPIAISSGHGLGIDGLKDAIAAHLPEPAELEEEEEGPPLTRIAVVGKPNVGKSSFVNAVLNADRSIVDSVPGTTRDALDVEFRWKEKDYLLIDTAGMRKKAGIRQTVEHFSVSRSLASIKRADVCLLMIDAIDGMSEQDKRIVGFAQEQGTAMVMAWTKWDLVENREKRFKAISDEIDLKMPQLKHVPFLTISNVTRRRIYDTFDYVDQVAEEAKRRVPTAELNQLMEEVKAKHNPPSIKGKHAKILYATQASAKPTVFVIFVNQKRLFHFSYVRYIENQIRAKYGFGGVPIRIELREGKPRK